MAQRKLRIMISSRSDAFAIPDGNGGEIKLRKARTDLKTELEASAFLDAPLVEIWINEGEHGEQTDVAWDECIKQAIDCDLFIAMYDGDPGWDRDGSGLGICQAEFDAALGAAPQKVHVIRLPKNKLPRSNASNYLSATRFLDSLKKAQRFETHVQEDWPELRSKVRSLVRDMVLRAAHEGVRQFRKSGLNTGQALDWTRMDFVARSSAIAATIAEAVAGSSGQYEQAAWATRKLGGADLYFACHGAPRSMSEAAGRETVGKPFFNDHKLLPAQMKGETVGPVHLIGCPKGVTDLQAITLLGTSDITVVPGSFGVYAVDRVNMVQVCLLADCADPGSTRNAVTRLFEWLGRSGEDEALVARARSRKRILAVIAQETSGQRSKAV